ncbi:helix-turn-helix domain-containing protein [Streptomyces aidingensis]|uniref:Helix-turn-helix domain-containing protein n=1 Tax=Streptomyces aidingensis TaxID=910347 RepID=A0A1I1SHA8_9ACTN|nr:helix-turn-helix transcriptional regulator [Streptomyces aidingensis]SFD45712.1 Helix-turn-helix domain-containing protein [Streptomyces aidingensis]
MVSSGISGTAVPSIGADVEAALRAGPTLPRLVLGAQLRRLREAGRFSREAAGEVIRASHSKICRLELGRTGFKLRDVADLLDLYGVTDEAHRATLLELAERANTPGWWQAYADVVPDWLHGYLGAEQAASVIRTYEVQFVPGLLQTPDYARAVIRLGHGGARPRELDRRVELRGRRRQILGGPRPVQLWAVIDEAALRRPVGGADTMRGQLRHLIEISRRSHVTVQVLPFSAGGHAAAGGPVTLLRLPGDRLPDVVYLEQLTTAVYLDRPADTDPYWDVVNRLAVEAACPEESRRIIARIMAAL